MLDLILWVGWAGEDVLGHEMGGMEGNLKI